MWGNPTLYENWKITAENFVEAGIAITNDNDSRSCQTDCQTIEEQLKKLSGNT